MPESPGWLVERSLRAVDMEAVGEGVLRGDVLGGGAARVQAGSHAFGLHERPGGDMEDADGRDAGERERPDVVRQVWQAARGGGRNALAQRVFADSAALAVTSNRRPLVRVVMREANEELRFEWNLVSLAAFGVPWEAVERALARVERCFLALVQRWAAGEGCERPGGTPGRCLHARGALERRKRRLLGRVAKEMVILCVRL